MFARCPQPPKTRWGVGGNTKLSPRRSLCLLFLPRALACVCVCAVRRASIQLSYRRAEQRHGTEAASAPGPAGRRLDPRQPPPPPPPPARAYPKEDQPQPCRYDRRRSSHDHWAAATAAVAPVAPWAEAQARSRCQLWGARSAGT